MSIDLVRAPGALPQEPVELRDVDVGEPARGEVDLRRLWGIIRRGRWIILGAMLFALGAAGAYILLVRPIYEASALIRIEPKEPTQALGVSFLATAPADNTLNTEMAVLQSPSLADKLVARMRLRLAVLEPDTVAAGTLVSYAKLPEDAPPRVLLFRRARNGHVTVSDDATGAPLGEAGPGELLRAGDMSFALTPAAARFARIRLSVATAGAAAAALSRSLDITRPDRAANVLNVSYRSPDSARVNLVPNELVRLYMARRQALQRDEAQSTVRFLRAQLDTLAGQLAIADDSLRGYRERAHIVSLPDEQRVAVEQLGTLETERATAEAERAALARLLDEVRSSPAARAPGEPSPYRRLIAFPTLFRNQATSQLLRSLDDAEAQRSALIGRRMEADPDVQVVTHRISELEEQLRTIALTYLEGLTNQVASLDDGVRALERQLGGVPEKELELARLQRQPKVLEEMYSLLQTRLKEAEIAQTAGDPAIAVVSDAEPPIGPVTPNVSLALAAGGAAGLLLGIAIAFAREHLDRTVHTRRDVQAILRAPVLGLIPRHDWHATGLRWRSEHGRLQQLGLGRARPGAVRARMASLAIVSEAFRGLRTNIRFAQRKSPIRTLLVTSAVPGEGKTTAAVNLAIMLAEQGLRTLLLDADMRRGTVHAVLKLAQRPGLAELLTGAAELDRTRRHVATEDGNAAHSVSFAVICSGAPVDSPANLLGSEQMRQLLDRLQSEYDVVVLDSPPINVTTDALVLSTIVHGVLLITRAGQTTTDALAYAAEQLRAADAPIVGTVLNAVDPTRETGGGWYAYSRYYASRP